MFVAMLRLLDAFNSDAYQIGRYITVVPRKYGDHRGRARRS
jgi:hypothetical protein